MSAAGSAARVERDERLAEFHAFNFIGWNFGPGGVRAMPAGATHPVLAWQLDGHRSNRIHGHSISE